MLRKSNVVDDKSGFVREVSLILEASVALKKSGSLLSKRVDCFGTGASPNSPHVWGGLPVEHPLVIRDDDVAFFIYMRLKISSALE